MNKKEDNQKKIDCPAVKRVNQIKKEKSLTEENWKKYKELTKGLH